MKRWALCLLALAACTNVSQGSNARGGDAGTTNDGATTTRADAGAPAPQPLTCIGILQCAQGCASGDDACGNACVAKGSADAQSTVTALAQCYQTNSCADATCIQTHCKTQLDACLQESQPPAPGQPSSGNAPPGVVPPELVGTWGYIDIGGTQEELVFDADGSGQWIMDQTSEGTCVLTNVFEYTGNFVVDATTITLYTITATTTQVECGTSKTTPETINNLRYSYEMKTEDGVPAIVATDLDCLAKNDGDDFYCKHWFKKQ